MNWTTEVTEPEEKPAPEKETSVEIDNVIQRWADAAGTLSVAKRVEDELRWGLAQLAFPNPVVGTQRVHMGGGFALKLNFKYNYTIDKKENRHLAAIDQILKLEDGKEIVEACFKWVPEFIAKGYEELPTQHPARQILSEIVTVKPAMPQLELETPNKKGG